MFSRRKILAATTAVIPVGFLAACGANAAKTDAQVLADASGIVNNLLALVPAIEIADPSLLPSALSATIVSGLNTAKTLLGNLSASTPAVTGASTLKIVESYVNAALNALSSVTPAAAAAFPGLSPYVATIEAVTALVPVVEAFVNSSIAVTTPTASLAVKTPSMSVADARKVLGIPTVK